MRQELRLLLLLRVQLPWAWMLLLLPPLLLRGQRPWAWMQLVSSWVLLASCGLLLLLLLRALLLLLLQRPHQGSTL